MLTFFNEYTAIKDSIAGLLKLSGYRNDYVAQRIGLSRQNFSVKKQRKSWTPEELQKIIEVITGPNEEVEDAIMVEIMRSRKEEPDLPISELEKEMGWK